MKINEALVELRKGKKRKFSQSLDLIVNLKMFDVRKEALNTFIFVPNSLDKKVGAFLTKRSKEVDTITEEDFVKYKEVRDIKKLAKKYDLFIAVAPMMGKVATKFGRVFGPANKMPSPQAGVIPKEDDEIIKNMLKKLNGAIRIKNKEMAVKIVIGKEDMDDAKLVENFLSAMSGLEKVLPKGKDNVREVMIKFTMTKPEKVDY